ncbi:hypothetical protein F7725_014957 [Dissostichus mawsoni]|uniref:Stanniocalcin n=1 Tax=Dissostichus mawsoni TaxID=36200 RepID=A0A7J5YGE4_DISMA|nr:hypothetical protein F7725_014957 [Dissostichus mawsoni]
MCSTPLALLLVLSTASCFELLPEEAAPPSSFNTEGKTFVKKSLHCITQGISTKIFQTIRRCNIFQRMIAETLQSCDEQTVSAVRAGLISRLGPDMETFLQLLQNQPCSADSAGASAFNNPSSWKNTPVFNIQPGFRGRDPTHLFARKRSVDDMEGASTQSTETDVLTRDYG